VDRLAEPVLGVRPVGGDQRAQAVLVENDATAVLDVDDSLGLAIVELCERTPAMIASTRTPSSRLSPVM
jgi:hypothetical protein